MNYGISLLLMGAIGVGLAHNAAAAEETEFDLVVYGGTSAAVVAAVAGERQGLRVALVSPDQHLGGLTASGLGWTDSKKGDAIGGVAREFYHRIWLHYRDPSAWTRTDRAAYAQRVRAQPGKSIDDDKQVMWTFEPHVAEEAFDQMLKETKVVVYRDAWLNRQPGGVEVRDGRIRRIHLLSGQTLAAKMFIDATYEGDLMAAAGVTYRIGRDSASEYDEPYNGIFFHKPGENANDTICAQVDPYVIPGDPASGLIAGITGPMPADEKQGDADHRLQSFNFRPCMSDDQTNRVPIQRPEGYDPADYELLLRLYEKGHSTGFSTQEMPNRKTDSNNNGIMSLDFTGGSFNDQEGWVYSEASYEKRREIIAAHRRYILGLMWTIMHNPRISEADRAAWSRWGLAADEFTDNGNWPYQLYVREARRMVGETVMTQHHVQQRDPVADSIGLGSYSMDSHVVRRVLIDGKIRRDGTFYVWLDKPYPISYGAIVPRREEITNLLVPVTLSATHVAFGSIRMEPTYMILGHSAATAAAIAIRKGCDVQEVPYADLSAALREQGQVLRFE